LLRIDAIEKIRQDEAFQILAASYKRIRNIIKDNESTAVSVDLFEDDAESRLYELYSAVSEEMQQLVDNSEYVAALQVMLKMKEPVDRFFDEVMVMAENEEVRQNRLNLLTSIGDLILQIGDISKIN
jgi:glycyl-tRNA synthetase beta chain